MEEEFPLLRGDAVFMEYNWVLDSMFFFFMQYDFNNYNYNLNF